VGVVPGSHGQYATFWWLEHRLACYHFPDRVRRGTEQSKGGLDTETCKASEQNQSEERLIGVAHHVPLSEFAYWPAAMAAAWLRIRR